MQMCIETIVYTILLVFAITAVGYGIGKLNKFGDSDEAIHMDEEG